MKKLYAKDCSAISKNKNSIDTDLSSNNNNAILKFLQDATKLHINTFSGKTVDLRDSPLVEFNYQRGSWYAGRFVGQAVFPYGKSTYQINIKPRFGSSVIEEMLSEVFNVRFSETLGEIRKESQDLIFKKLIAYLWIHELANANKYGLPRKNIARSYKGAQVKGRLKVRPSIIPAHTEEQVVSTYRSKTYDAKVLQLLQMAFKVLKEEFDLSKVPIPKNAKHALNEIISFQGIERFSRYDYSSIKLSSIYVSYKKLVEFSWGILQNTSHSVLSHEQSNKSVGMFLDMAEIWETYLRKILTEEFKKEGWELINDPTLIAYPEKIFERKMIPDIVLKKGKELLVFDAKYKRMEFRRIDIDRADFFQIHTYVHYYQQQGYNVKLGGLLYPITNIERGALQNDLIQDELFSCPETGTTFFVDGVVMENEQIMDKESFKKGVKEMTNRIKERIQT
ncbi:MAG: McrC family protein [Gracilimonas sp.]|uniref:5-methylcytosine restriction system specificity protein McrC n=1 Tax=Gracilimonas sp. TaxID=1974203 RepID=UPI003751D88A|nr:McrC family protein [Gracilimonas sp.]